MFNISYDARINLKKEIDELTKSINKIDDRFRGVNDRNASSYGHIMIYQFKESRIERDKLCNERESKVITLRHAEEIREEIRLEIKSLEFKMEEGTETESDIERWKSLNHMLDI